MTTLTKEQFIKQYCEKSGIPEEWCNENGFSRPWGDYYSEAEPCDCGEEICKGWKLVHKERS